MNRRLAPPVTFRLHKQCCVGRTLVALYYYRYLVVAMEMASNVSTFYLDIVYGREMGTSK